MQKLFLLKVVSFCCFENGHREKGWLLALQDIIEIQSFKKRNRKGKGRTPNKNSNKNLGQAMQVANDGEMMKKENRAGDR
jgi:hypothetical protein